MLKNTYKVLKNYSKANTIEKALKTDLLVLRKYKWFQSHSAPEVEGMQASQGHS